MHETRARIARDLTRPPIGANSNARRRRERERESGVVLLFFILSCTEKKKKPEMCDERRSIRCVHHCTRACASNQASHPIHCDCGKRTQGAAPGINAQQRFIRGDVASPLPMETKFFFSLLMGKEGGEIKDNKIKKGVRFACGSLSGHAANSREASSVAREPITRVQNSRSLPLHRSHRGTPTRQGKASGRASPCFFLLII